VVSLSLVTGWIWVRILAAARIPYIINWVLGLEFYLLLFYGGYESLFLEFKKTLGKGWFSEGNRNPG